MTKYPNSACQMHRNVETSEPVCIICMGNNEDRLRDERDAFREVADGLAEALERISLMSCRCIDDGKPCPGCTKSGREAPVVAYQALAKYWEKR